MCDVDRIKREMALRGWYQKDLAAAAGISVGTVSRLMQTGRARDEAICRIAAALDLSIFELIKGRIERALS